MTEEELRDRILHRAHLEQQDPNPAASHDPSFDMTEDELRRYCNFLYQQLLDKDRMNELILSELRAIKTGQGEARTESLQAHYVSQTHADKLLAEISELRNQLMSAHKEIALLLKENRDLRDAFGVVKGEHYGSSKSQKGISKQRNTKGRNDGRDDFDGTASSLGNDDNASCTSDGDGDISFDQTAGDEDSAKVYHGPDRKGCKYSKSVVGEPVVHLSDRTKLPVGTVILSSKLFKIRDVISQIIEHHFERLKVKYPDGRIETLFLPEDTDLEAYLYEEIVPGTHVTANLLSYLLFNKYQMSTPSYRETKNRLADMNWDTCRQNLSNWADKGAVQLNKLIPALKDVALQAGSDINVDETWERYQTHYGHKKTYMWCLVNKKAGIVIFFYEDCTDTDGSKHAGGRRRKVLMDFLGDAKLRSLQSDGYNVYMYLDEELIDIDHLCCLAHARAKFKKALDQGCEKARYFLLKIGNLYSREEEYRRLDLPPDEIFKRRNDAYTNGIVEDLWKELFDLLALPESEMSDLMRRALNYLHSFWKQLFNYRKNGEYTIDNLAAERAIRPLTVQRKNSLFFCSTQGALNSATYNTFIETCKHMGISFRDYFRRVMKELQAGRVDYENLLPQTIGLKSTNKY